MIRKYPLLSAGLGVLTLCGAGFIGAQSSEFSQERSRYLKLDAKGNPVAAKMGPWSCVLDRDTGLVWEVKSPQEDIHYKKSMYSWHLPEKEMGIKAAGTCHSGKALYSCDSSDLVRISRQQNYCGLSSWRLPSVEELQSILYAKAHEGRPKSNPYLFPRTYNGPYWSADVAREVRATKYPDQDLQLKELYIATVHFGTGRLGALEASRSAPVRLVATAAE